jgi:hypothetical protein
LISEVEFLSPHSETSRAESSLFAAEAAMGTLTSSEFGGNKMRKLMWTLAVLMIGSLAFAQEKVDQETVDEVETVFFRSTLLEVTPKQHEGLTALARHFDEPLSQWRDEVNELQDRQQVLGQMIQELERQYDQSVLQSLTEPQRKVIESEEADEWQAQQLRDLRFLHQFPILTHAAATMNDIRFFRGVPREKKEQPARVDQPQVEKQGYAFFSEPMNINSSAIESLRKKLVDYRQFEPYAGPKFCGGFHPDLCIEWDNDEGLQQVFICLTCREALAVLGETRFKIELKYDLVKEILKLIKSTADAVDK